MQIYLVVQGEYETKTLAGFEDEHDAHGFADHWNHTNCPFSADDAARVEPLPFHRAGKAEAFATRAQRRADDIAAVTPTSD